MLSEGGIHIHIRQCNSDDDEEQEKKKKQRVKHKNHFIPFVNI